MPHKTVLGDIGDPDGFPSAIDNIIEQALKEMKTRKLISVAITPLAPLGGWPLRFGVTVVAEAQKPGKRVVLGDDEPLDIVIGDRTIHLD